MAKKQKAAAKEPYVAKVPHDVFALPDGHHIAYWTGFTKKGAEVYPAPTHTAPMEDIRADRAALDDFIDAINRHAHAELRKLRRREDAWWENVRRDLGIKRGEASYHYFNQCFKKVEPKPDATQSGQGE